MIIQSSNIEMTGMSMSVGHHEVKESLRTWVGQRRPAAAERVEPSPSVRRDRGPKTPEQEMLVRLIELLTGKKVSIRWYSADDLGPDRGASRSAGFGVEYERRESHYEAEQMRFQASGIVRAADGREIALDIDLGMSREFYSEESVGLRAGDALKDPLVLNFDGNVAELTQTRFQFDIDADGQADAIPFTGPGSGILALDRDGNGRVDDGSELFGAVGGDGFADLSAYDSDGNRWIDGNDPVFDQLRIWTKDADGRDRLAGLATLGVGAIHLGRVSTEFSVKDSGNALLGQVRESGVFLMEDGTPGVIQKIDLSV